MKKMLLYFNMLITIISVIPLWNFEHSTIDLLSTSSTYSYIIFTSKVCGSQTNNIELKKTISKDQNGIISEQNYLTINSKQMQTNWEDIRSYCLNNEIYICPKGKYHLNKYNSNINSFSEIIPNDFSCNGNWELKCFAQPSFNLLFIGYLNQSPYFYAYKYKENNKWSTRTEFNQGLFDFKWKITQTNNYYPMICIALDGNIKLQAIEYSISDSQITKNTHASHQLIEKLSYSNAYFNANDYKFYFITYNKNPPNFKSGYYIGDSLSFDNVNSFTSETINTESPLDFFYNFTIIQMNFIVYTRYAYYEILNTDKNKTYHGIIDIILNKILFNTDEKINIFKPYISNNGLPYSMLIITDKSAFKICALSDSNNNNECIEGDSCPSENYIVDSQGPNYCGDNCNNYILLPNKICIDKCDENIFYANDSHHCGFCIHMNINKPNKLLNHSGCLSDDEIPPEAYLYNAKYKLYKISDIVTTIPTTILTTIITTIPPTILTAIPTTILTTIPTSILTTIPTTILTTIPTIVPPTILTAIPTTILTKSQSTILETSIITILPTTIIETTIIMENIDLCNKSKGLYPVNYGKYSNKNGIKCLKVEEKHSRVYFDNENQEFKTCYETCNTCDKPGNNTYHNCITCEPDYQLRPEGYPYNNCVPKCPYYAFTAYEQYKCIENLPCPKEYKYLIEEKNKCIDDCKRDNTYKYLYNGRCFKKCPNYLKNENYLCMENKDEFVLTENNFDLNYAEFINSIENLVKTYSSEYSYTDNHVTQYKNEEYNTIIYKNKDCINELSLDFPEINFGNCYNKIQTENNITDDLIIAIINIIEDDNNPITSYSFFDPKTGDKLNTEICKNDTILIEENILSLLNENMSNYNAKISLMKQGINIFNSTDEFYTNLCYDYNYDTKKDIAFQDRLKVFYPNISLCDPGCTQTSIDFENFTATCECQFKDISNNNKDNKKILNLF